MATVLKWRGKEFERKLFKHLQTNLKAAAIETTKQAKQNVSGPRPQRLDVGRGFLRANISWAIEGLVARIGVNKDSPGGAGNYARIHELGGRITPKRAKFLHFKTRDGNWVMTKVVNMPARPYLRLALMQKRAQIVKLLSREFKGK